MEIVRRSEDVVAGFDLFMFLKEKIRDYSEQCGALNYLSKLEVIFSV